MIGTRRTIIDILKKHGPATPSAMAAALGVTAVAVRQHLADLSDEKVVEAAPVRTAKHAARGRPAVAWRLTEAADRFFPDGHEDLAVGLIHGLRAAFGEGGIRRLVAQRTEAQVRAYTRAMAGATDLAGRLERLANIRTREGYMAEIRPQDDGTYLLIEHHCPICAAAKACTGLCASELDVFSRVLGDAAEVSRTDHMLAGANRCAYRVALRNRS